ncbi:multiubiquitin domain-containing protein [Pseudomonas syringae]|uniref:multiubiquitin domain-containing protein n=1 Tax=Pseudomonas syringae TaxID=317 RepID=UPI00042A3303|nr:multiubiquitin domain-containing protein [Pseudomonas syringae]QGG77342.1 prokaryotic E2 family E [Pseudomonas syringae USA011]
MNEILQNQIFIAGLDLEFKSVPLADHSPIGMQIARAGGFTPDQMAVVLQALPSGVLEDIRPDEVVDLAQTSRRFIVAESDRTYFYAVDGQRYEWPCAITNGQTIRSLAQIPNSMRLVQQLEDEPDHEIADEQVINLGEEGIERFVTRKAIWKLKVQGVLFEFDKYEVTVREAATRAGLDLSLEWKITLTVEGHHSPVATLDQTIDLRTPGIEKLRFSPKDVGNGEAIAAPRGVFKVLPIDVEYLNRLGLGWETCLGTDGQRYLLIHDYELPAGYNHRKVQLALQVPAGYPAEPLDSFYIHPHVMLTSGVAIPNLCLSAQIDGLAFQGWSRHRTVTPWNPQADNVISQMALVEDCLYKEIGQ